MTSTTTTTTSSSSSLFALLLLLVITFALVTPSSAEKMRPRYVSERKARLSEPVTDALGLALKIGFHSGCSGCIASDYGFNWCVHPDNDGIGACVPGDCSGYNYFSIFDVEEPAKRAFTDTQNFKDGAYICNEREPEFRTRDGKNRVSFGVQGPDDLEGDAEAEYSALTAMADGNYYADVDTFSHAVFPNFCNIPADTLIDRTQGGPDFLINAGYEHCLMANSELRPVLNRECGPESQCYEGYLQFLKRKKRVMEDESLRRDAPFFLIETSRFFFYQCAQFLMESQEQRDHYNWIIAAIRSVSCVNDCHPYGVPVSGICQNSCTRINEAFLSYVDSYDLDLSVLDPLLSQFNIFGDLSWYLGEYVCVPDDTPLCQEVDLKNTVTGYFHSRISPATMTYEEEQLCLNLDDLFLGGPP